MRIDFHHHIFPKPYVDALASWEGYPRAEIDSSGRLAIIRKQDTVILPKSAYDMGERLKDLDRYKIDIAVLSLSTPFIDVFPLDKVISISKAVNDSIAKEVEDHPNRVIGLGTLPMKNVGEAIEEAKRVIRDLGMKGFVLPTSIDGIPPASEEYVPLYQTLESLGGVVFFHPNPPAGAAAMSTRRLVTILGYLFDTTLLIARLIYEGVLDRVPNLKIVTSHQGGALPYLVGRLNRGFLDFKECREKIYKAPVEYLKRLYADTISFDRDAMLYAHKFFGEDKLLYGTDYPFLLGTPQTIADDVKAMKLSEESEKKIFSKNASKLLGLR